SPAPAAMPSAAPAPRTAQTARRRPSRTAATLPRRFHGKTPYTRAAVAAVPPAPERRRARRGSLERPVNGRLYRGTWLLVGLPLLVLAFSVARPAPLPPSNLPPSFDRNVAAGL